MRAAGSTSRARWRRRGGRGRGLGGGRGGGRECGSAMSQKGTRVYYYSIREFVWSIFGNEMFETSIGSATRRSTGAKFRVSLSSPEYSKWHCCYENPKYGLNVLFKTKWIRE